MLQLDAERQPRSLSRLHIHCQALCVGQLPLPVLRLLLIHGRTVPTLQQEAMAAAANKTKLSPDTSCMQNNLLPTSHPADHLELLRAET